MIAEKEKTENKEKAQKPVKKTEKYIWFLASAVIAAIGAVCHTNEIKFNIWVSVVYSAFLLFTIIMAAQRTSIERFGYADEESETADKTKYALTSILYYIFIIIARNIFIGYPFPLLARIVSVPYSALNCYIAVHMPPV